MVPPPRKASARRRRHRWSRTDDPPSGRSSPRTDLHPDPEPIPSCFVVGGGCSEAVLLWPHLSKHEKFDVLDVTVDEIADAMFGVTTVPHDMRQKMDELISDSTYMTAIRLMFVEAINPPQAKTEVQLPPGFQPCSLALLKIFDRHLVEVHGRYHISARFVLFVLVTIFLSSSIGYIIKALLLGAVFLAVILLRGRNICLPDELFSALFSRSGERIDSLMTNTMLFSFCYWSPYSALIKTISMTPYTLLIIKDRVSGEDVAPLQFAHTVIALSIKCITLYFTWYSWIWFLSSLLLLVPSFFLLIAYGLLLGASMGLTALNTITSLIRPLHRLLSSPIVYFSSLLLIVYSIVYRSVWGVVITISTLPIAARGLISFLLTSCIPGVLQVASPITIIGVLQFAIGLSTVVVRIVVVYCIELIRKHPSMSNG